MATATKFMKFSLLFCFRYNFSLTNSTQFGNDLNYSKFNGENIETNSSVVTVLALDGLTKKHFGHYAFLKIFSLRSPSKQTSFKATSHSTIFDIPMRPVREDQRHRRRFTC